MSEPEFEPLADERRYPVEEMERRDPVAVALRRGW